MRGGPRGPRRSVDRGERRPAIERRKPSSGCRCPPSCRRQRGARREREAHPGPASSEDLACAEAVCPGTGRSPGRPCGTLRGPRRQGRRPWPTTNGLEKSDLPIAAAKRANEVAQAAEEPVERRGGTRESADPQATVRTRSREAVSRAQARTRGAVTRKRTERLSALLHHVSLDALRAGCFSSKTSAAPGVDGLASMA